MTPHEKRSTIRNAPKFIAVDFFCGAGGATRGLIDAGGYVVAGVDKEGSCRKTYEANNFNTTGDRAGAKYVQMDIFDKTDDYPEGQGEELMRELQRLLDPHQRTYPHVPLLFAICAPCQPFTGLTRIEMTDERRNRRIRDRGLLAQTFKFVQEFAPTIIISENVAGIQNPSYGGVWQDFMERLKSEGYVVGSGIVDASEFGVPQKRKRSIMVAVHKNSCRPDIILNEGGEGERLLIPEFDPEVDPVTVAQAIGHLPPLKAGEKHDRIPNHQSQRLSDINLRRIQLAQPGGRNDVLIEAGLGLPCHQRMRDKGKSGGFSDFYMRMAPDRPAPTITTKCTNISNGRFGHFDPSQDRGITVREAAALQSFPDDYEFYAPSLGDQAKMVGNAIPPRLMRFFAIAMVRALRDNVRPYYFPA